MISNLKHYFECIHYNDQSEDHVSNLIWNFMSIYHVLSSKPYMNDLNNFEEAIEKKIG